MISQLKMICTNIWSSRMQGYGMARKQWHEMLQVTIKISSHVKLCSIKVRHTSCNCSSVTQLLKIYNIKMIKNDYEKCLAMKFAMEH